MHARHILVVEDSDEDFETVQDAARRGGMLHRIVRATTGGECLRLLRPARAVDLSCLPCSPRLSPDSPRRRGALPLLVLLDLNTPGDESHAVLRELRSDDALGTLPVVVLSASASPRDLRFCYANGANAYHVKPVDHAVHLQVLQAIFAYWLGTVVLPL